MQFDARFDDLGESRFLENHSIVSWSKAGDSICSDVVCFAVIADIRVHVGSLNLRPRNDSTCGIHRHDLQALPLSRIGTIRATRIPALQLKSSRSEHRPLSLTVRPAYAICPASAWFSASRRSEPTTPFP